MSRGCELVYDRRGIVAAFLVAPERVAVASALKNKSGAFLHKPGGTVDYFTPECVGALYFFVNPMGNPISRYL